MKRSNPELRQPSELKANVRGAYGEYIKHPSKVSNVFTQKPWLGGKEEKNGIK
ncbi:hypothetical protein [Anaerocolumna chitinilytica]|uniref:Uncharacterized protein n=1 Tax=Anaerocolumna chitinilytica TaxID=1727145 RepID=A0A7M3SAK3_9FIRM|nr:hypothetical protein [Anaerocolumna chitinilytica]BCK01621.1 hypothetical protein bsdcttw_46610 [Anaerocolumna chitinilytica]